MGRSLPVGQEEISQRKFARHRKARMDARTRERLPVLPVLARTVDERRKNAAALLEAARRAQPGEAFTAAGQTLTRPVTKSARKTWADDPAPASAATWASKTITRSGPGPPSRSSGSRAAGSRKSWRSATTA